MGIEHSGAMGGLKCRVEGLEEEEDLELKVERKGASEEEEL